MHTYRQSDTWIYHISIVLGIILLAAIACLILMFFTTRSLSELLVTLGFVTAAGLAKLFISPLYWGL